MSLYFNSFHNINYMILFTLTRVKRQIYSPASTILLLHSMPKNYTPNAKEKYMCEKQKTYFKKRLADWKKEIIELNSKGLYLNDVDHEISSPDIVDQAASQTEKSVKTLLIFIFPILMYRIYTSL